MGTFRRHTMQYTILAHGLILPLFAKQVSVNETVVNTWFNQGRDNIMDSFDVMFATAEKNLEKALTRTSRFQALEELDGLRRFKALKTAVLWLSADPGFGKYCYYGCYCLPALHDSEGALAPKAKGTPIDGVDAACKVQTDCYACVNMDTD